MTVLSRVCGGVVLVATLLPISLHAQGATAWSECRADSLAGWNCGGYYSGIVTFRSEFTVGTEPPTSRTVTATITAGRVMCRVEGTETERFEAPGMAAVSPAGTLGGGEYEIIVWCPETADERVNRDTGPSIEIRHQRAANYAILEGTDDWEDADAVNGVTESVSITWRLQRQ